LRRRRQQEDHPTWHPLRRLPGRLEHPKDGLELLPGGVHRVLQVLQAKWCGEGGRHGGPISGGLADQDFRPPAVRPETTRYWPRKNTISTGSTDKVGAASWTFQRGPASGSSNRVRATGTASMVCERRYTSRSRNWFQLNHAVNTTAEAIE